ncbi:hypothetical protein VTN49DRAFT_5556 [Thermomyces lanuginosus]|uniref:uncharacterized protein n=1 Tax=Thermomyces lanuginosus TaxID=5541 RepID=UPI0037429E92
MAETPSQEPVTATENGPVNVEVDASNDSSYGDDLSSYSASLISSVFDYRHESGRRYHGFRNGGRSTSRLGPVSGPLISVIGCDLSPIQPTLVPPNVKFLVDDIESEWAYESNPFDLIHARSLMVSIRDHGKLLKGCYRSVKPGGWVEFQDWDGYPTSEDGSFNGTRDRTVLQGSPKLEQWFKDAGFVNIHVEKFVIPYGVGPKDKHFKKLGAWNQAQAEANGYEGVALAALTRRKNWTKDEVIVLASQARADSQSVTFA